MALALLLVKSVQHARRMKNGAIDSTQIITLFKSSKIMRSTVLHHSDTRRNILLIMAQDGATTITTSLILFSSKYCSMSRHRIFCVHFRLVGHIALLICTRHFLDLNLAITTANIIVLERFTVSIRAMLFLSLCRTELQWLIIII